MRRSPLLRSLNLNITAELARFAPQPESPKPGDLIDLGRSVNDPVTLFVNGQPIARGTVIVMDDHFAVEITELLSNESVGQKEAA